MKLKDLQKEYPYTYKAVSKMFEMAGKKKEEYDEYVVDDKDDPFYLKAEWTKQQQDEFAHWLYELLYNDAKARKEIMRLPVKRKSFIDKAVSMFIFNYGLKLKE